MHTVYTFEDSLLDIKAKILQVGTSSFIIESPSFCLIEERKYDSFEKAKEELGNIIFTRYCRKTLEHQETLTRLRLKISDAADIRIKTASLDSWIESLNQIKNDKT